MKVHKFLEDHGFYTFKHIDNKFNELKKQFIEMGQLKSDFDIEKFTVKKEGNFIAHNFHFLMRQYSLTLSELRRMLLEKELLERKILKYSKLGDKEIIIQHEQEKRETYADIYTKQLINQLDLLEISIVNKAMMVKGFEVCRLKLIEINGGKVPTNEQYQAEEPKYWKWFLINKAKEQLSERQTGIKESVWMNIRYLEEPSVINPKYQVKMLDEHGRIDLNYLNKEFKKLKK